MALKYLRHPQTKLRRCGIWIQINRYRLLRWDNWLNLNTNRSIQVAQVRQLIKLKYKSIDTGCSGETIDWTWIQIDRYRLLRWDNWLNLNTNQSIQVAQVWSWIHAHLDPCISASMHIWIHAYLDPCISESMDSMHIWIHVYLDLWISGS